MAGLLLSENPSGVEERPVGARFIAPSFPVARPFPVARSYISPFPQSRSDFHSRVDRPFMAGDRSRPKITTRFYPRLPACAPFGMVPALVKVRRSALPPRPGTFAFRAPSPTAPSSDRALFDCAFRLVPSLTALRKDHHALLSSTGQRANGPTGQRANGLTG